ncbi:MAG: hypothetical protein QOG52_2885 [Frankiaceae bacterium]|nr:hypothetical protein [Frankiaceae bacterium]
MNTEVRAFNTEARAATTLLLYSATMTPAIVLGIAHSSASTIKAVLAFGLAVTFVWSMGPALFRLLSSGRH